MVSPSFPQPRISRSSPAIGNYQLEIVKANGLKPLLRLLQSQDINIISAAVSCVRHLTLQPANDSPVIEAGFSQPLVNLLAFKGSETIQSRAATALCNLAASIEKNQWAVVNASAVQSIKELVVEVPVDIQIKMTTCIERLSRSGMHSSFHCLLEPHPPSDGLKGRLLEIGIVEVLVPLTKSPNAEVRRRSGAALRNLTMR